MDQLMGGGGGTAPATVHLSAADCALLREACHVAAGEGRFVHSEALYCQVEALGAKFGALAGAVIAADPGGQAGADRAL